MLQNLGLHRNCDGWNISEAEKENRKRCFFVCFVVDRLSCAMFGRTPVIDERDYDTPYPSDIDGGEPQIIENFLQLIKLASILGSVLRQLYTVHGKHELSIVPTPDRIISSLDKQLNMWLARLPPGIQYSPPNTRENERQPAPAIERCQLHMLFYTTLILLHRPFIPGPTQSVAPSVFPSGAICTYAANKILDIAVSLYAEGRLKNVNSYTLYFMFTAGIIFINDAATGDSMTSFESKISINKIMRGMEQAETTWRTSARHTNILGELAGLRDINYEECAHEVGYPRVPAERQQPPPAPAIAVPASPEPASPQDQYQSASFVQQGENQQRYQGQQDARPFDPIGTAFWGVPTSFDIDEWNSYLNSTQQQSTLPQQ